MFIQRSLATEDQSPTPPICVGTAVAPKTTARLAAEAAWFGIWHTATAAARAWRWAVFAERVRHERRALATLDHDLLADLGLSREQALQEAGRHWTDLPKDR